ncbi:MAG: NADH-quinone oxidoreductase subunit M [Ferruginibacter sp.]
MNLLYLIWVPLVTALLMLLMKQPRLARVLALAGSLVQLGLAIALYVSYLNVHQPGDSGMLYFEQVYAFFPDWNISFHIGVDGISIAMILLTALVVVAGVLVSWEVDKMAREYFFLLILLSLGAYGFFISIDLMILFFFLEVAVIPKYMLIAVWGSGKKEYSANKLALMLMGGSALVLVGLLILFFSHGIHSFDMQALSRMYIPEQLQRICFLLIFTGFGVFSALFPFHTWVPDGHSSAPTAGSMFLAGISMKLGGYGCLKAATYLFPQAATEFSSYIIVLSAIAILYGAFATMMQKDLKYINAYSSVSHCGFVLLGIGMLTRTAVSGAVMQMVSHGLMTALFFAVIGMIYSRTHTRQVSEMGGLMKTMPFITTIMFIVGLCSLGLPGLSGFVAEMTIFIGSWEKADMFHRVATIAACMSIVVTAVYILRAIGLVAMGPLRESLQHTTDAKWYEKAAAILLVLAILAIGLVPGWLVDLVGPGTDEIMKKISGH